MSAIHAKERSAVTGRRARAVVVALVVLWVVAQLVLVGVHRYFAWDEAIYFAKASAKGPTLEWGPARSLGLPAMLWPVLAAGGGIVAARIEMLVLSAAFAVAAYALWSARIGYAAPAAAVLFLSSWPAVFYGTAMYPNLIVALTLVGAIGGALLAIGRHNARPVLAITFVLMAIASCTRPTDALLAMVAAAPWFLVMHKRAAWAATTTLAAGLLLGVLVWVVEAVNDFGGPVDRFRQAFLHTGPHDPRRGVLTALAQRPISTTLTTHRVLVAIAWIVIVLALAFAGCILARSRGKLDAVLPAASAGALLGVSYVAFAPDTGVRFMLPALALVTLPAGVALDVLVVAARGRRLGARLLAFGCCALVALACVVHGSAAHSIAKRERGVHDGERAGGKEVAHLAAGRPCRFVSQFDYPSLVLASGCSGANYRFDQSAGPIRGFSYVRGTVRFAVGPNLPAPGSPIAGWAVVASPGPYGVRVYVSPEALRPRE